MSDLGTRDEQPKVCFNVCKREAFLPNKGFKAFHRKLKQFCLVDVNKEVVTLDRMMPHDVVIFGCPTDKLSPEDIASIHHYVDAGGSVFLALGDGQGGKFSYANAAMDKHFGITFNEDCVVRTVMQKCLHPKEVCVTHGITNREINRLAGKTVIGASNSSGTAGGANNMSGGSTEASTTATSMNFMYPHGLTMNVQRPSFPILSSGFMAFPLNRPIAAVYEAPEAAEHNGKVKRGKLLVLGSGNVMEDSWINKEENEKLVTILFDFLLHKVKFNQIDADEPEITDYHHLPDTGSLSERLRVAVEEGEDLPRDFTKLFDFSTYKLDTSLIPEVSATYQKLGLKQETLTLIPPEFQAPLPPCLPATFDPTHREAPPPALDLFDLDEHFAPERVRLAQLTNKCALEDLELYVTGSSDIIGVSKKLRSPRNKDPRALLDHVFRQVMQYKKANPNNSHNNTQGRGSIAGIGGVMMLNSGGGGVGGGGGAPAESMTRVMRIYANGDGSTDAAPFDGNVPWDLTLQFHYGQNIISGTLELRGSSDLLPPQQVVVEGQIDTSRTPNPLEWGFLAQGHNGETLPFIFNAEQSAGGQGSTLQGSCQCPATDQRWDFMYLAQE
eukprot:GFYU01022675.1.p1 GENE.GFYU01022675.1~~GFYU01022675.1.p1  ORF type:complete len:612 (+),score=89.73 GFYU01022675.1:61-1896(+)